MVEISIFISSKMQELAEEREMLYNFIPSLSTNTIQYKAWVFEEDAPASDDSIREIYLDSLHNSALYIGLFWNEYGEWTIDEFDRAGEWNIPRHIYVKDVEINNNDKEREDILTDFLNNNQDVERGLTHKWFKTLDELKKAIEASIKTWTHQHIIQRPGDVRARLFRKAADIHELPDYFVGRDGEKQKIDDYLKDRNVRVLIQGFGGEGKTALAAKIASEYISETNPVLWLRLGSSSLDAAYEALAAAFDATQAMAKAQGDEKRNLLRELLKRENVGLVILDDSWDDAVLQALSRAIPRSIPVIATARNEYRIGQTIKLGGLLADDAFDLLNELSGGVGNEDKAYDICEKLGYLAFAVEIAGRTMQANGWSTGEMLQRLGESHTLEMPNEYRQSGRESVAVLLEQSILSLSNEAQKTFFSLGAFFSPTITPELMALYQHPDSDELSLSTSTLDELQRRALVKYNPATDEADETVAFYQAHGLSYSYATAQLRDAVEQEKAKALVACLTYTNRYNEPSRENFKTLEPELDNFMGAATFAMQQEYFAAVEKFAWDLYFNAGNFRFLAMRGYYTQATILLQQASLAAQKRGNKRDQGAHLGNLGLAYRNLGQYEQAINYHQQALAIAEEIGNKQSQGAHLANLGLAYRNLGQAQQAIDYYQQALAISREIGDRRGEGQDLGNLGLAYNDLGQYEQAIDCQKKSLVIKREIGDRRGEGNSLGNLGLAYRNLGQYEQAIDCQEKSLGIKREIGDKRGEGNSLGNLGLAHDDLGQTKQAIDYYQKALAIAEEIGYIRGEGVWLGNLGNAYAALGQIEQAIDHYQQTLAIAEKIGDIRGKGVWLGNLSNIYAALGQTEQAIDYYQQALAIAEKIGDRSGISYTLNNLGVAYVALEDYEKAIAHFEKAAALYRSMGVNHLADKTERNLELAKRLRDA